MNRSALNCFLTGSQTTPDLRKFMDGFIIPRHRSSHGKLSYQMTHFKKNLDGAQIATDRLLRVKNGSCITSAVCYFHGL